MKKILFLLLSIALLVAPPAKPKNHRLPALGMPRSTVVAA